MKKEIDRRMHSAEHILNQTMVRMFLCGRCLSAHIERKKSKCDYRLDRHLSEDEIREIERQVNEVIHADMPVTEEYITKGEAQKRHNLGRVPSDTGNRIRIVTIGDYDSCPCIGPHVGSTREIGEFVISSASFNNGVLRLRYKLK